MGLPIQEHGQSDPRRERGGRDAFGLRRSRYGDGSQGHPPTRSKSGSRRTRKVFRPCPGSRDEGQHPHGDSRLRGRAGRRVVSYLLDTNLVIQSWSYQVGSESFDCDRIDELYRTGQERLASDLVALHDLFAHSSERGWPIFCVAPATVREVGQSTERDAAAIIRWAYELAEYAAPDDWRQERISHFQAEVLHGHSRGVDSILLAEAGRLGCEA